MTLADARGSDPIRDRQGAFEPNTRPNLRKGALSLDDFSSTIIGGCLNPSKGRFLHPEEDRQSRQERLRYCKHLRRVQISSGPYETFDRGPCPDTVLTASDREW